MAKLVVTEFVSLDGIMEDPGGGEGSKHGAWTFEFEAGPERNKFKLDELFAADAQLLGRVTYEGFAKAWPSVADEEGFGDRMNSMPKYVVSNTLTNADATWNNSKVIRGDVLAEIARLKGQPGGDLLVHGSCRLVDALVQHGLVEYHLMVYPIILGSGKRLFGDAKATARLELVESKTLGDGVLLLSYRPAAATAESAG
jgi:dihydrofolate reductase